MQQICRKSWLFLIILLINWNIRGYWSEIDTADPNSATKRGVIEQRWFGGFSDWTSRLNKVESKSSADLLMQRSFHQVLYSASQSCTNDAGTAAFTASLDISVSGSASLHIRYGKFVQSLFTSADVLVSCRILYGRISYDYVIIV
jgi:hypothetical protein